MLVTFLNHEHGGNCYHWSLSLISIEEVFCATKTKSIIHVTDNETEMLCLEIDLAFPEDQYKNNINHSRRSGYFHSNAILSAIPCSD
jgi:hypothetical protein